MYHAAAIAASALVAVTGWERQWFAAVVLGGGGVALVLLDGVCVLAGRAREWWDQRGV